MTFVSDDDLLPYEPRIYRDEDGDVAATASGKDAPSRV